MDIQACMVNSDHHISLTRLTGKAIKDILLSIEYVDYNEIPIVQVLHIELEDGSLLYTEGFMRDKQERWAIIDTDMTAEQPNMDYAALKDIGDAVDAMQTAEADAEAQHGDGRCRGRASKSANFP
jgi:hypothetical protein